MRIDTKQVESMTFWRYVKPQEYAAALAGRGPVECPYCHGHYPRHNITYQGRTYPDMWCLCQARDYATEIARSRGMIEHRMPDHKVYRLDQLQDNGHRDYGILLEAITAAQSIIDAPYNARWLTLMGLPGNGKSHILMAIRQALPEFAAIIYADAFADDLREAIKANAVGELKNAAIEMPVLLIDDLGTEHAASEFVAGAFNSIISQRYMAGKERPTVVSTNFAARALIDRYGRTADRLLDSEISSHFGLAMPSWRTHGGEEDDPPLRLLYDTTPGTDEVKK